MCLIKSALLLSGGIYAAKKITKKEKKCKMQKSNNNNNQDIQYMYGGGQPGQNQQYYQPQPQYQQQQQQQRPGKKYEYNGTRDGPYPAQEYGNGRSRGQSPQPAWENPQQSQYGYAGNGHNDSPPAYVWQDEKRRMN